MPMDNDIQKNHLKAYGLAYWVLDNNLEVDWLLNYRGGSFMCDFFEEIEKSLWGYFADKFKNLKNVATSYQNKIELSKIERE